MNARHDSAIRLWIAPGAIWVALVALVALTVGSAFIPLGILNGMINAGVAATKVTLVMIFYMKLKTSSALLRLAALAGLFWLILMFTLTSSDFLTR